MAVGQSFEGDLGELEPHEELEQLWQQLGLAEGETLADQQLRFAEEGNAEAQYTVGVLYGMGENYTEMVKWFRLAADQGHAEAQSNLGYMYANGDGVPRNDVTAYAWWNIAAASGHEEAISNRSIVEQQMTPAQISEAQQLSTEIFERIQQGSE